MSLSPKQEESKKVEETGIVEIGQSLTLQDHDYFYVDEDEVEAHCDTHTWSNCDATTFSVRVGPDYVPGQKRPSGLALYKCFALDGYGSPSKIPNFARFAKLEEKIQEHHIPYDRQLSPLPPVILINAMIPNYRPPLIGDQNDGDSFNVVLYAGISDETRAILEKFRRGEIDELPPSIRLFANFIHCGEDSPLRRRFKVIVRVANTAHVGLSYLTRSLVSQYNAKPFLARTSTTFYHVPGRYFAVDLDAHHFGKPARAGLNQLKSNLSNMIYDVAFVVEGVENEELPEQILCCARVNKMGPEFAQPFDLYEAYKDVIPDPHSTPLPLDDVLIEKQDGVLSDDDERWEEPE